VSVTATAKSATPKFASALAVKTKLSGNQHPIKN